MAVVYASFIARGLGRSVLLLLHLIIELRTYVDGQGGTYIYIYLNRNALLQVGMRSKILSKLIFASCV